jgi:hypothetical protein
MSNSWGIPGIVPGRAQFTRILPGLNQESSGILLEETQPGVKHLVDNGCGQEYMVECKELEMLSGENRYMDAMQSFRKHGQMSHLEDTEE